MRSSLAVWPLVAILACACSAQISDPEGDAFARRFIEQLVSRGPDAIASDLAPSAPLESRGLLAAAAGLLGTESRPLKLVGTNVLFASVDSRKTKRTSLTYETQSAGGWRVVFVTLEESNPQAIKVAGFYVRPVADSLEHLNAFTFQGKRAPQVLVFASGVAAAITCLLALVACVLSRVRRKGWWLLACAVGVGELAVDWTTGGMRARPLAVELLGFGVSRNGVGPWIVQIGLPIGAILFLIRRRRLLAEETRAFQARTDELAAQIEKS